MDIGVYSLRDVPDEKIGELLDERKSFVLEDIDRLNFSQAVETVERKIEARGMKCRVYTAGRSAVIAAAAVPTPVTVLGGWASALAIGAHNLATWDPDYELAKNVATGRLDVNYKK
jgi:hypothetical protein